MNRKICEQCKHFGFTNVFSEYVGYCRIAVSKYGLPNMPTQMDGFCKDELYKIDINGKEFKNLQFKIPDACPYLLEHSLE